MSSEMKDDLEDGRPYTEYQLEVEFNGTVWMLGRKFKEFCTLHQNLVELFPSIQFPDSSFQFQ
jgi:hypothetical protein